MKEISEGKEKYRETFFLISRYEKKNIDFVEIKIRKKMDPRIEPGTSASEL